MAAPGNPFLCSGSRGSGPKSVPGDSVRRDGDVISPPPRVYLPHPLPRDLGGGGGTGREEGRLGGGLGAGARGLRNTARKGHQYAKEGAVGAPRTRLGKPGAGGVRRESLPFRVAHGDLFPGEPPPSSSQPREQRVWEAPPGSGSEGGGRQEGRRWGQGGRLPTFPLAAEGRRAPSSQRLSEAPSKPGRARVPHLTAPLAPFLP